MKIFLDFLDERTKHLKTYLNDYEILDAKKDNFVKAKKGDLIVFPPNKKWTANEVFSLPKNVTIFCGNVDDCYVEAFKENNIKWINFLDDELFSIENAKLTAEGVLALVLEHSPVSIFENQILILGGGRISKSLALLFEKLGLNFCIASFSKQSFLESNYFCNKNYFEFEFLKDIKQFDVIINTRPLEFFDDEKIKLIKKDCLFLETASKNCLDETKVKNFYYLKAPALPTKYSFKSASKLLLKKIMKELKWRI